MGLSLELWRMGKEQSHVLPSSSQQLPFPLPAGHIPTFSQNRLSETVEAGFPQHCAILSRKQVIPCSQVSEWK